jgi:predicted permease
MDIRHALMMFGLSLVAPLLLGQLMRGRVHLPTRLLDRVVNANVHFMVTILGVLSLWVVKIDAGLLWMPLIACMASSIAGLVGAWRARRFYDAPASRGSFVLSSMISNRNTAGTIAVFLLLGEQGYANARLFVAVNWPYLFAACYPVAAYYQIQSQRQNASDASQITTTRPMVGWRTLLHPNLIPILGLLAGLLLNIGGVERPAVFSPIMTWLIPLNMWLFLVPLGYELDLKAVRQTAHDVLGLSAIKFILTPIVGYALGKACGLSDLTLYTCVILCASPVAIQAVVTARIFKLDHPLAMGAFILTMMIFLLIVTPVIMLVFWWFDLGQVLMTTQ